MQRIHTKTGNFTPLVKLFNPKKVIPLSNGAAMLFSSDRIVAFQKARAIELLRNDTLDFTGTILDDDGRNRNAITSATEKVKEVPEVKTLVVPNYLHVLRCGASRPYPYRIRCL